MCMTIWNHLSAQFRVICSIRIDRINRWDLIQQNTKTCESLTLFVVSCTAHLQGFSIYTNMQFTSLPTIFRLMFFAFPFNFTWKLQTGTISGQRETPILFDRESQYRYALVYYRGLNNLVRFNPNYRV